MNTPLSQYVLSLNLPLANIRQALRLKVKSVQNFVDVWNSKGGV